MKKFSQFIQESNDSHAKKGGTVIGGKKYAGGEFTPSYKGEHEAPDKSNGSPIWDLQGVYPEDFYSSNGFKYYCDSGEPWDYEAYSIARQLRYRPGKFITVYRAVPKDSDIKKINPGDWVTTVRSYAIDHGKNNLKNNYKILKITARGRDLFTDGNSISEWGYDPQPYDGEIERRAKALRTS